MSQSPYFQQFFDSVDPHAGDVLNRRDATPTVQNDATAASGVSPTTQAAIDAQVVDLDEFDPNLIDIEAVNELFGLNQENLLVQEDVGLLQSQPHDLFYANAEEERFFMTYGDDQEALDLGDLPRNRILAPPLIRRDFDDLAALLRERRELQNPYAQVRMPDQPAVQTANAQQVQDARAVAITRNRRPVQQPPVQPHDQVPVQQVQAGQQQQQLAPQPPQQPPVAQPLQVQQPVIQQLIAPQPQAQVQAPLPALAPPAGLLLANRTFTRHQLGARPLPHNYIPLGPTEATFPRDQAAQDVYLRELYDAFVDITGYLDTSAAPFAIRLSVIASGNGSIKPHMVSTVCSRLLSLAMALHTVGPSSLKLLDAGKMASVYKYRMLDFGDRIARICELLRLSKSRCQSLLKFEGLEMMVGTAPLLVQQTNTNHKSNQRRAQNIKDGAALLRGLGGGAA
jgi:hypothetical protein